MIRPPFCETKTTKVKLFSWLSVPLGLTFLQLDVEPPPDFFGKTSRRRRGQRPLRRVGVSRRRLGCRDRRVSKRRVAVGVVRVSVRMRMGVRVALGTVPGHPLRGVVDAGGGAAAERVGAEAARGVRRIPLGVGQLLVVGLHRGRHHVEHDDGRAHGLAEHVLGSGIKKGDV